VPKAKRSRFSRLFTKKKSEDAAIPVTEAPKATPAETSVIKNVLPKSNGFVDTIISAYKQHHALVLRPDDVWIAILTQFNFYVNANAELLRANFVAHDGQKTLELTTDSFDDFGRLAREMVGLIEKNVVDPTLRAWALPDFSTTTLNDITVSSIVLMATLKSYFEYVYCEEICGIPRVTLEGERGDWEKILKRLEKLKEYGIQTIAWYHLLAPVISRFVRAFDDPTGKSNIDFWQSVVDFDPPMCGSRYYSGWITAFCVFTDQGKWIGPGLKNVSQHSTRPQYKASFLPSPDLRRPANNILFQMVDTPDAPDSFTAERFWAEYGGNYAGETRLDGTRFHKIDCDNVPPSYAEVDVTLVAESGEVNKCTMTAGVVAMRVSSSGDRKLSKKGRDDTVRPVVGWWLFDKLETAVTEQ
jgi:hypothetical protein